MFYLKFYSLLVVKMGEVVSFFDKKENFLDDFIQSVYLEYIFECWKNYMGSFQFDLFLEFFMFYLLFKGVRKLYYDIELVIFYRLLFWF